MGAKLAFAPRGVTVTVPLGAEDVIQPLLKSRPIDALGALHALVTIGAAPASGAAAAASAAPAAGGAEAEDALGAEDAPGALPAVEAAPARDAALALGAAGRPLEEDPTSGTEPHPPIQRAASDIANEIAGTVRMESPCAAL